MTPITDLDKWDKEFEKKRLHLQNDRGMPARAAWERARLLMKRAHGPRPRVKKPRPRVKKPPWKTRIALWAVRRKLEGMIMDGKKSKIPKWLLALGFGLAATGAMINLAMADGSLSWGEAFAIGNAVLVAAAGKFSNPEKKLSHKPSRLENEPAVVD